MILSKGQISALVSLASKDSMRSGIGSVQLSPRGDGSVRAVSTDGHALIVLNLPGERPGECDFGTPLEKDALLPADQLRESGKVLSRFLVKGKACLSLSVREEKATVQASAYSGEPRMELDVKREDFPRIEEVLPKPGRAGASVSFDARLMVRALQALIDASERPAGRPVGVTLQVAEDGLAPLDLTAKFDVPGVEARALVMPMRL